MCPMGNEGPKYSVQTGKALTRLEEQIKCVFDDIC